MNMRWLKKREVIIYFLLFKKFRYEKFNIGDAFSVLGPYFSKKVTYNSISYMTKIGLITKLSNVEYRLNPFDDFVLSFLAKPYLERRVTLRRRIQ
ncbi:MAG: hypothetical protein QXY87_04695 [Saccharolobus sp.]|uniref:hypothetical protein n=1 Tax=Saccharolobus TaxID=2100760 RepID=UPI001C441C2D|nr:hypothetical protein [Saccharolobus shibatae]MCH4815090.1 hypothetical protein [Saccharolobus shibatae]